MGKKIQKLTLIQQFSAYIFRLLKLDIYGTGYSIQNNHLSYQIKEKEKKKKTLPLKKSKPEQCACVQMSVARLPLMHSILSCMYVQCRFPVKLFIYDGKLNYKIANKINPHSLQPRKKKRETKSKGNQSLNTSKYSNDFWSLSYVM